MPGMLLGYNFNLEHVKISDYLSKNRFKCFLLGQEKLANKSGGLANS